VNYLNDIKDGYKADEIVGSVTVPESALSGEVSVPVKLQSTVPGPTSWWKLTHPFD
jgi:hypothetical protein